MMEPFLFRFKQNCSTKMNNEEQFYYDDKMDMVMIKDNETISPAIHHSGNNIPGTKKADLEKGEDSKDTMMWS